MFIFGGVGDASVYRDDLWFLYVGTTPHATLARRCLTD
jgi:hypothetical protein